MVDIETTPPNGGKLASSGGTGSADKNLKRQQKKAMNRLSVCKSAK